MIVLKKVRSLDLVAPTQHGRKPHLSAASGLVRAGSYLYAVADDELSLTVFDEAAAKPGELIRLLPGELPLDPVERKAAKADFESLLALPSFPGFDHGALLALASGSKKKKRHTAALLPLAEDHSVRGSAVQFDLAAAYEPLHREFARLNIEGAVVHDGELRLFQRGTKKDRTNAILRCKLAPILEALSLGRAISAFELLAVMPVELGELDSIPLSFTDAAVLSNGGMIFSAAAEDTDDAYDDGPCSGSAVGVIGPQGDLLALERVSEQVKLEGIAALERGDSADLLLVSDADDAEVPATLYAASIKASRRT
jgi:hypothetical protein